MKITSEKILYSVLLFTLLCAVTLLFVYHKSLKNIKQTSNEKLSGQRFSDQSESLQNDNSISIVFIGYGGIDHPGGTLSDSMTVARINPDDKSIALISIPRDIWIELPIRSDLKQHHKINMAHAIGMDDTNYPMKQSEYKDVHGGGNMVKDSIEKIVGFPVDYYASVSFSGFEKAIDQIDGVSVNVPVTFSDKYYPVKGLENELCGKSSEEVDRLHKEYSGFELEKQFECRYEELSFNQGLNEMDGAIALKYVRSRHSDTHGSDFARGVRAQSVLIGIKNKLLKLTTIEDIVPFARKFRDSVRSDIKDQDLMALISQLPDLQNYNIESIDISEYLVNSTSSDGQYILVPKAGSNNFSQIQSFIYSKL